MPLDECPDGLGTEQASFANTRLGKQVVGHFIEIMRQPVVDRRRETGFRLAQPLARQSVFHRLAQYVLGSGAEKPLRFNFGGTFQATNSANSRSRNGTRTSTEDAMPSMSL